jgi:cytidylate kinase
MPIIAISADIYETGLDIAKRTAEKLGYRFLGSEFLSELAQKRNLEEKDLLAAINSDAGPTPRRTRRCRETASQVQAACLEELLADNTVCYGLGAHLYLEGVSHALRVHVISDPRERAADLARKEGMPLKRAPELLKRREQRSHRWSREAFGGDECEPALYDMGLNLTSLEPEKAVDLICDTAATRKFQAMTYSKKCLTDKLLASQVRCKLLPRFPRIAVSVSDGTVVASLTSLPYAAHNKKEAIRQLAREVSGIKHIEVHLDNRFFKTKRD